MHRNLSRCLAAVAAIVSFTPAFAVELSYRWKAGDVHRFTYEDDTAFEMSMSGVPGMGAMGGMMGGMPGLSAPGMSVGADGMKVKAKVTTTFSQKVLSVKPDGTADIELTVERMEISADGMKAAVLSQIPPAARVVRAEVDRKGHARFYNMVTVYVQDEQMYVGVHKVSASADRKGGTVSATASASAGGETVTLVAAVNPKTGTVTASASVKSKPTDPPPPALRKVQIREDAQQVEVLPKQIFEMMVLPDEDLPEGGRAVMKTILGEVASTVESLKPPVAKVRLEMVGNQVTVAAPAEGGEEAGGDEAGMPGTSASTKMDVDARYEFDVSAGRLLAIAGMVRSDMSMGGMGSVKTETNFSLRRVK